MESGRSQPVCIILCCCSIEYNNVEDTTSNKQSTQNDYSAMHELIWWISKLNWDVANELLCTTQEGPSQVNNINSKQYYLHSSASVCAGVLRCIRPKKSLVTWNITYNHLVYFRSISARLLWFCVRVLVANRWNW